MTSTAVALEQRRQLFLEKRRPEPRPRAERALPERATYSLAEAAARLGCCREHVRRLANAGALPGVIRLGKSWKVSKEPFERWLADPGTTAA